MGPDGKPPDYSFVADAMRPDGNRPTHAVPWNDALRALGPGR